MRTLATLVFVALAAAACSRTRVEISDAASAEPVVVAAGDLAREYQENRARADAAYKGRRVRVSGVVRESRGESSLVLGAESDADALFAECFFSDDFTKKGAFLRPGLRVTLECDCDGFTANVVLRRCNFGSAAPAASAAGGPSSLEACHKLEAAGIAAGCKPATGADSARFDVVSSPGKGGLVVRLADDATYTKYVAGLETQGPTSPLRPYFGSAKARVVVHLVAGVTADAEKKTKAVVDAL